MGFEFRTTKLGPSGIKTHKPNGLTGIKTQETKPEPTGIKAQKRNSGYSERLK